MVVLVVVVGGRVEGAVAGVVTLVVEVVFGTGTVVGVVVTGTVVIGTVRAGVAGCASRRCTVTCDRQAPGQVGTVEVAVRSLWSPRPRRGIDAGLPYAQLIAAIWRRASATPSVFQGGAGSVTAVTVTGSARSTKVVVVTAGGSATGEGAEARATA